MKILLSLICCCYSWHCFYLCWTRKSSFFAEVHECIHKRMGYIGQTNSTKSFWLTYAKKIGYFQMLEKIILCLLLLGNRDSTNVKRLIQFCWILCLINCLPYLWRRRTANKNIHPITGTKLFYGPACYPFAANFCKKFMVSLSCVYIQHFVISKFLAIKLVVYWEIHTFLNNIKTFKKR